MTQQEYTIWAKHHATVFGFQSEADMLMLRSWIEVLGTNDPEMLHEATKRLAASSYPEWPRMHLAALTAIIRTLRAEELELLRNGAPDDRGMCVLCTGSGRVPVPHPRSVANGKWMPMILTSGGVPVYYDMVVYCSCPLGAWFKLHNKSGITLGEYEKQIPNWKLLVAIKEGEEREVERLSRDSRRERPLSDSLKRLMKKHGISEENLRGA